MSLSRELNKGWQLFLKQVENCLHDKSVTINIGFWIIVI
jgi:hypothetical protein